MANNEINNSKRHIKLSELNLPKDLKNLSFFQCNELCREIRRLLIKNVSKNGGHLSSNLGTVELSLAIHRVFESPKDKIIWDVGHQSYTHKILTGRLDKFSTLRKENGISGFPKPSESIHDGFISGHSSNSISAACGIARGMKLKGDNHHTVVVIGDGAFTGGLAYEGLNNAGKSNDNIIVILNHNDMSISKNVGALAKYLSTIRSKPEYLDTKKAVGRILDIVPAVGEPIKKAIVTSKTALKGALYHSTMFEDFGFIYLGPVDGHNIEETQRILERAKSFNQPVLVHVNTVKGKGYSPAERNPGAFHGVSSFELSVNNPEVISDDSYSAVFGKQLVKLAESDSKICALTAAMKYGTGLQYFAKKFPKRFFDVGIAEQHAVTFSAGLASEGMLPVFAVYSSFLQRAYDQILHDNSIDSKHIVIGVDRAGFVGEDGETHQGLFDVSFLTTIPNITIFSPSCYEELSHCLVTALYDTDGIAVVRYPRGNDKSEFDKSVATSEYYYTEKANSTLVVTYGRIYDNAVKATDITGKCDLLKLTKIFPVSDKITKIVENYENVIFFEEGIKNGGVSEHIVSSMSNFRGNYKIVAVEGFVKQASVNRQLELFGLSTEKMIETINGVING
ncbi:MAG: 1-deoxy-D-xylulose-5-phosphate synthase [Oscillospiraceae bacterium]|nr:1-deoxy-D-xylulose-5-phosphate synthase [Oscillospiraceae bacterium]